MKCAKCNKENFKEWKSKEIYKGIDYHHNPPEFTTEKVSLWRGEIITLCRNCHDNLHKEITKILIENSSKTKSKTDYWIWMYVYNREKCRKEIIKFTKEWVGDDTKTITEKGI